MRQACVPSLSPGLPADKRALLEGFDGFAGLRNMLRTAADDLDHWAGIPMPLDGTPLVVEPRYPKAQELMDMCKTDFSGDEEQRAETPPNVKLRNRFWSHKWRSDIAIIEVDGKITYVAHPGVHHLDYDMRTMGCSNVWGIEQEGNAVRTLGTLLRHRQFKQYLLTGMFMEKSKRSDVHYFFRKLKPTVAISVTDERTKILCCLCLHPIAYYTGTWAGSMTPTDDIVAHLMLMRGDEAMFWRRANQHPAWRPEAGL